MQEEKTQQSGPAGYQPLPATAPAMPHPPPYNDSGGPCTETIVPQRSSVVFAQQPSYAPQPEYTRQYSYASEPSYTSQTSRQQLIVVQTPQVSVIDGRSRGGTCSCCRRRWNRRNGFCTGGCWVVLGIISMALFAVVAYLKYGETKDFKEGKCKTHKTFHTEDPDLYTCLAPDCEECRKPFTCNKVVGKIHYSSSNHSKLTQIFATYEDTDKHQGQCSFKPHAQCKGGTERYFLSSGAFEGHEYPCYYSTSEPLTVVLKRNSFSLSDYSGYPFILIFLGVCLILVIKFFGHKCGCPSKLQIQKQQEQQVQIQLQPLLVKAT